MDIIEINKMLMDKSLMMINIYSRIKYMIDYPKFKKYITKNIELKDKYKGQRCYILGNGPSIKDLDIDLLKGKNTFVVNGFYKSPMYEKLEPTFHCIYDKFIFEESRTDLEKIVSENKFETTFIFNRRAIGKLANPNKCYYVYSTIFPTTLNNKYDLAKNANTFLNVIPFVIMCAIYMGFSEIILLGCDFSLFASRKESHFYDQGELIDRKESLFQDLQGHAIVCCQHRYLRQYANSNGIKIINATPNSLLDIYPQDDLLKYV